MAAQVDKLGLTTEDKEHLITIWEVARKDLEGAGIELFIILFSDYPHLKKYFKLSPHNNVEELRTDPVLRRHGLRVVTSISEIIDNINDADAVLEALTLNAKSHKMRNINKEAYDEVLESIIKLLESACPNLQPAGVNAWRKALKIIFDFITAQNA